MCKSFLLICSFSTKPLETSQVEMMEIPPEIGTEWIFVDYVVGFHLVAFSKKIFKGVLGNK